MQNTGLEESQAGIETARRNTNNLRYTYDSTLMAESKEELNNLLMKVKEESEKNWLKTQHSKNKDHGIQSHCVCLISYFSRVWLFATLFAARLALGSMGFSRQEYWSGLSSPSPGDLPNPGIEPGSPSLQVDSLPLSMANRWGKKQKQWQTLFYLVPKSLQMVTAPMKFKDACSFEEKLWQT